MTQPHAKRGRDRRGSCCLCLAARLLPRLLFPFNVHGSSLDRQAVRDLHWRRRSDAIRPYHLRYARIRRPQTLGGVRPADAEGRRQCRRKASKGGAPDLLYRGPRRWVAKLAGIAAQIGYKRPPGSYGGRALMNVDSTLDRLFDVDIPDRVWVTDITYIRTLEGFASLAVAINLNSRRIVGWLRWLEDLSPIVRFPKPRSSDRI